MIQSPYPPWPLPRHPLAILRRVRDAVRGYSDADLRSYDDKVRGLESGRGCEFTEAEQRAAEARRRKWGRS